MGTAIPNMLVDNMPALGGILLGGSFSKVVNSMLGEGPSREGNMPTIGEIPNSMPSTDDGTLGKIVFARCLIVVTSYI